MKFGLGKDVGVNAIIGLPLQLSWRMVLDLNEHRCSCLALNTVFPFEFTDAASGLPRNVKFDYADFVRPPCHANDGINSLNNIKN